MNSYVQLAPDQAGKKVQQYQNVIGGNTVDAMAVSTQDSTGWSNSYVEVREGLGKKMQYFKNTIGGTEVYAQALVWVGIDGLPL